MQKEISCIDSFWYPTLTEWKVYEIKEINFPDEVLTTDDAWHKRRFPMKQFDVKAIKIIFDYV